MCVVVVWIPVDESYRVEIKKFVDAKAPLNMLKYKMQFKSEQDESYKVFHNDIQAVVAQQNQFLESVERKVAEAEAIDPVQAFFSQEFLILGVSTPRIFYLLRDIGESSPRSFLSVAPDAHRCLYMHAHMHAPNVYHT